MTGFAGNLCQRSFPVDPPHALLQGQQTRVQINLVRQLSMAVIHQGGGD